MEAEVDAKGLDALMPGAHMANYARPRRFEVCFLGTCTYVVIPTELTRIIGTLYFFYTNSYIKIETHSKEVCYHQQGMYLIWLDDDVNVKGTVCL